MNAFASLAGPAVRPALAADEAPIHAFLAGQAGVQPFHLPQWGRAVEAGCGHRWRPLLAHDDRGEIIGWLPLSEIRSPLFGSALVSAGFGVGGGIVGLGAEALADAAWALAEGSGCASVELRGGVLPRSWERREGAYAGFVRDLPPSDDDILLAIPRKQRAEIRKSLSAGLTASVGRDLDAHYRVYSESVRNLGTPVFPRALFAAMLDAFGPDADILVVRREERPVAAVLSFYHGGTVYPYWGGGTAEARGLRAGELMYFELMRHAAARGCTRFDFGRSKVGTGPFAFKKNWGFEPEPLVYAARGKARETNPLDPKYRLKVEAWKKLPLWLANRIGPPIARGLG